MRKVPVIIGATHSVTKGKSKVEKKNVWAITYSFKELKEKLLPF